jgi:hypothetical protein
MRNWPNLMSRIQIALALTALGALAVSCGSITVGGPDGGGSGGAPGGGTGGVVGAGTGGTVGGGTGGLTGAGGHGTGGRGGAGGAVTGTGGAVTGTGGAVTGTGGAVTGTGGVRGTGGAIMGTGGATTGTGGAGAVDCQTIANDYAAAVIDAKVCNPTSTGATCQLIAADKLQCGCPTSVDRTDKLDPIVQRWNSAKCSQGVCPAIACRVVTAGVCLASLNTPSSGTCQDQAQF